MRKGQMKINKSYLGTQLIALPSFYETKYEIRKFSNAKFKFKRKGRDPAQCKEEEGQPEALCAVDAVAQQPGDAAEEEHHHQGGYRECAEMVIICRISFKRLNKPIENTTVYHNDSRRAHTQMNK